MRDFQTKSQVVTAGKRVILRDTISSDVESCLRWFSTGEHLLLDAPGERNYTTLQPEQIEKYKSAFAERCEQDKPDVRGNAIIATTANLPIGTVNRYGHKDNPYSCNLGISIQDDAYLNKGLGTEALQLWLNYQFSNTQVLRIGVETWSFNPRAIRVIENIGFKHEGTLRNLRKWEGQILDKLLFGLLREEWEQL
ncbi:MAG: GNAT family N-acetyltransferase [Calditrichaeota bacterium]|nr:GNAT family N-acetyltransferase [Calditrichota bacterium]